MLSRAGPRYLRGSNSAGFSANTLRTAAVIAKRESESILILQTADFAALRSCSSGIPIAASQEIAVVDNTPLNVKLSSDAQQIEEVVVTALGIKRATKALSYNVQEIKNDDITQNKDANFVNALAGKVAGVNINASSSGVGIL